MPFNARMEVSGLGDTLAALKSLPDKPMRRVLRKALNAGGNPVVKAARANVHSESGLLKKSIGKKVVTSRDKKSLLLLIGPRSGEQFVGTFRGKKRNPVKYAHLVELGTSHSAARPFLRPALDSARGAALSIIAKKAKSALDIEVMKLARKRGKTIGRSFVGGLSAVIR